MIPDASLEAMAKLPSAFKKGGVTAATNGINDAAAAVVVMSKQKARN